MSISSNTALVHLAERGAEQGPNTALSYGIGALALGLLVAMLALLLIFGGGRDHS